MFPTAMIYVRRRQGIGCGKDQKILRIGSNRSKEVWSTSGHLPGVQPSRGELDDHTWKADSVTLVAVITCAQRVTRLTDVLAQRQVINPRQRCEKRVHRGRRLAEPVGVRVAGEVRPSADNHAADHRGEP